MKTSLPLSKELQKRGFKEPIKTIWSKWHRGILDYHKGAEIYEGEYRITSRPPKHDKESDYYAYDILYSLCIKHGKELFGEEKVVAMTANKVGLIMKKCHIVAADIIFMLQEGKDQDTIEDYIIKNLVI